jgi:tetratricopeptide (TPR) repeat protein
MSRGRKFRVGVLLSTLALLPTWPVFGAQPCARCHPQEVSGYLSTPMAHSMGPPDRGPSGSFFHSVSATRFIVRSGDGRMTQRVERHGFSSQYNITYSIGSGAHAIGYLVEIENHLFQSPLSYYMHYGWGMAPGYENQKAPDFYRPVTPDCLFCHAGRALPVTGTLNTYENPPFNPEAITCERCHGPAAAHVRNPVAGSIVNPAKLPRRARDSVCEQCHLSGEARIPNPGKQLSDFRAGENLEDVYTVYVYQSSRDPAHPNALTVISQSQQLALSKCARMSNGKLWCGTCHDPHTLPKDPVAYFRARCLSCHGAALLKTHPRPSNDCIGCHMPRLPVTRGGHTIFTDHLIAIYTPQQVSGGLPTASTMGSNGPASSDDALVAWRDPPPQFAQRNLGLAYAKIGNRLNSFAMVRRAYQLLFSAWPRFPDDSALLEALGQIVSGAKDERDAQALFRRVIAVEPGSAPTYFDMALAAEDVQDNRTAIQCLEKTLQIDPLLVDPYQHLARIYIADHHFGIAHDTYERFLKAFPENLEAKMGLVETER